MLIAEDGHARNGVHVFGVQEADVFGQIVNYHVVLAEERIVEGNVHAAVAVFNVEDHGVAANDYSKPYIAMPEMKASAGKYFRGDELPKTMQASLAHAN